MTLKTDTPKAAEIVREYGPFPGADKVHGVTYDGRRVWAATGAKLVGFDPEGRAASTRRAAPCSSGWRCRGAPA